MTAEPKRGSRLRLLRDVVAFQIKLGLEAIIDLTLIPVSLAAAGLDLVLGIEVLLRQPITTPKKIRELRPWAAAKLALGGDDLPPPPARSGNAAG